MVNHVDLHDVEQVEPVQHQFPNRAQVPAEYQPLDDAFNMIMQAMITNNFEDLQNGNTRVTALQDQGLELHQNTKRFVRDTLIALCAVYPHNTAMYLATAAQYN
jgi:hypothetical protein